MSNFFFTLFSFVIAIFFKDELKRALVSASRTHSQNEDGECEVVRYYNTGLDLDNIHFEPLADGESDEFDSDKDENILDECVFIGTEDIDIESYVGPSVYFLNPRDWGGNDSLWVYPDGRREFRRIFH